MTCQSSPEQMMWTVHALVMLALPTHNHLLKLSLGLPLLPPLLWCQAVQEVMVLLQLSQSLIVTRYLTE